MTSKRTRAERMITEMPTTGSNPWMVIDHSFTDTLQYVGVGIRTYEDAYRLARAYVASRDASDFANGVSDALHRRFFRTDMSSRLYRIWLQRAHRAHSAADKAYARFLDTFDSVGAS